MTEEGENGRTTEDGTQSSAIWEVEPLYYYHPGKPDKKAKRGKAYRNRVDGELRCFEAYDGVEYRPGEHVYIESGAIDPYIVGTIVLFKMSKRDSLSVKITRFFRPEDVPEISLSLILQERSEMSPEDEPIVDTHPRELFTSESSQFYPISFLRGKCEVTCVKDFRSVSNCDLVKENSFFTCLAYNQESARLASVQGEIRVGSSYQAVLPPEATTSVGDEADRDELIYRPNQISQATEMNYVQMARTFRIFSMVDSKLNSVEKAARVTDLLFDDSLATLHRCGYKFDAALLEMNANDKLLADDTNFMTTEDSKRFSKGIKTFGKNFMRIRRELLPLHNREQLVAYYYLWKKTNEATKPKALARQRNQTAAMKKPKNSTKASRQTSPQLNDYASASESECENETIKRGSQYACHHCYSEKSRDWHHAGRDSLLLCTDCRIFFKKYAQLRSVERPATVPPCLFKRSPSGTDPEEDYGVRTRAGKNGRRRTPSMGDERRSPSQAVSVHEFDMEKIKLNKNSKRKKSSVNGSAKKKKMDEKEDEIDKEVEIKASSSPQSIDELTHASVKEESPEADIKNINESMCLDVKPSTSSDIYIKNEDSDNEQVELDEDNYWEAGEEEAYISTNAIFVRNIIRRVGHRCSRTDLIYKLKPGGKYDESRRKREEAARNPPTVAVAAQVKKPEMNVVAEVAPTRIATNGYVPMESPTNLMAAFLIQAQQAQAQAHQQAQAQAQAHQQAQAQQQMIEQNILKLEMQRQQFLLQREAANRMPVMPFMDHQRMAQMPFLAAVAASGQNNDIRLQMELLAQQQMVQHFQQQNASMGGTMMSPDMHHLLSPQIVGQMMQHQLNNGTMPLGQFPGGMHPGLSMPQPSPLTNSDMMRRLQQEGGYQLPAAMRHQQ